MTYKQKGDPSYILINRWIPERDKDLLFEHIRQLREKRMTAESTTMLGKKREAKASEKEGLKSDQEYGTKSLKRQKIK